MNIIIRILYRIFFFFLVLPGTISAKVLKVGEAYQYKNVYDVLNASNDLDTIIIIGGTYIGNYIITKSIFLIGQNSPVLDGENNGTVLTVDAPNVHIEGLIIQNSGKLLDKENAGILVNGKGAIIKNNVLKSVLFGLYFHKADDGIIEMNRIEGKKELDIPRRGDLFRGWYCRNLLIKNNQFRYGRDVVIWFSSYITLENNNMSDARYGLHFMYNKDCRIIHNIMTQNSVGMYLMYSQDVIVAHNLIATNRGASGFGIGLKDLDNVVLANNIIADNRIGIFVDNSPRSYESFMKYDSNLIAFNELGMQFMSSLQNSDLIKNSFKENYQQTSMSSCQEAKNDSWKGNYWSDYTGYDKDNDGKGDIPYNSKEFVENLMEDKPNLKILIYSPAINALNYASQTFPILMPVSKLVDKSPSIRPIFPQEIPGIRIQKKTGLIILSISMTVLSGMLIIIFLFNNQLTRHKLAGEKI